MSEQLAMEGDYGKTNVAGDIAAVFDAWRDATGRERVALDEKRRSKIRAALKMYPVQDVIDAVRGWRKDSFYCGDNDRGKTYNELTLLLRDAEHIERFRDMERGPVKQRRPTKQESRESAFDVRRRIALGEL